MENECGNGCGNTVGPHLSFPWFYRLVHKAMHKDQKCQGRESGSAVGTIFRLNFNF